METIYMRLLGEGVEVFRPVPAIRLTKNVCEVGGHDFYDPEDEKWEFGPGAIIVVETRVLLGGEVLVAVSKG